MKIKKSKVWWYFLNFSTSLLLILAATQCKPREDSTSSVHSAEDKLNKIAENLAESLNKGGDSKVVLKPNPYSIHLSQNASGEGADFELDSLMRFQKRIEELRDNPSSHLYALINLLDKSGYANDLHFELSLGENSSPNEIQLKTEAIPKSENKEQNSKVTGVIIQLSAYPTFLSLAQSSNGDITGVSGGGSKRSDLEIRESEALDAIFYFCLKLFSSTSWKELKSNQISLRQNFLLSDLHYDFFFERMRYSGMRDISNHIDAFLKSLAQLSNSNELDITLSDDDIKEGRIPQIYFGQTLDKRDSHNDKALTFDVILDSLAEPIEDNPTAIDQNPDQYKDLDSVKTLKERLIQVLSNPE